MESTLPLLTFLTIVAVAALASLHQLSRRLDALQAQQELLLRHFGLPDGSPSEEVRALAQDPKRRSEAIKLYRQQTGKDLKAAVEAIDRLSTPQP